jgi:CRP-like cAMP-binding protein
MARNEIRIRAVPPWQPNHGDEAPFLPLSASDRTELRRLGEQISFKTAGSEIYASGEKAGFLYLLAEGVASAHRTLPSGERQVVGFYWPGDVFGLAEEGLYVNSASALTACAVYRFPYDRLASFLLSHPEIEQKFYVKAVHDLRNAQRQLIMMGRLAVPRRLAAFILDCSGHEDYFDSKTQRLTLPMTRDDIADYIGASPEVVIRTFGRLEALGLLRRVSPKVLELKTEALRAFVDLLK